MDSQTKKITLMHTYTQTDLQTNRWADIFMDIYSGRSDTKTHTQRRRQIDVDHTQGPDQTNSFLVSLATLPSTDYAPPLTYSLTYRPPKDWKSQPGRPWTTWLWTVK